jgi:hypothetical protein
MRYEALIAAVLVLSQVGGSPAAADPLDTSGSPQFTAAETSTVGRNEILRELIETDPWLVRRILDTLAGRGAADDAFDGAAFVSNAVYTGSPRTDAASVEWLELLHRVRHRKAGKKQSTNDGQVDQSQDGRTDQSGEGRSAQGSLELLDTMKKARQQKGGK